MLVFFQGIQYNIKLNDLNVYCTSLNEYDSWHIQSQQLQV